MARNQARPRISGNCHFSGPPLSGGQSLSSSAVDTLANGRSFCATFVMSAIRVRFLSGEPRLRHLPESRVAPVDTAFF
jgi:hypothetical protein